MKFTLLTPKPRNPMVALARNRHAGSHRIGETSRRQQCRQAMRTELKHLKESP